MSSRADNHGRLTGDVGIPREQWLGVESRHLVALVTVAQEGSFSSAAARLGYVQSAVSQQISALENIVGARLVNRSRGPAPVTFTGAGELLLEHAHEILEQLRRAHADLRGHARRDNSTLTLGVKPEEAAELVPRVLARLRRRDPSLGVVVRESWCMSTLVDGLRSGAFDAVIGEPPQRADDLHHRTLLTDPFVLLVPPGVPITRCTGTRLLEELATASLIGPRHCAALDALIRRMAALGLTPRWTLRTDLWVTMPALVRAGLGYAIVPRLVVESRDRDLAMVPLDGVATPRVVAMVWHRGRELPPALEALWEEAAAVCQSLAGKRSV